MKLRVVLVVAGCLLSNVSVAQSLSLAQALALVDQHPEWLAAQAGVDQAQAEVVTARQYPNPTLEVSGETRDKQSIAMAFPVETPSVRQLRSQVAETGVSMSRYQAHWLRQQLLAQIERLYVDIVKAKEEVSLTKEELALLTKLRHAVQLRVKVGESPRYEGVKAEAEWLSSKGQYERAMQQLTLAQQTLLELLDLPSLPEVTDGLGQEPQQCVLAKADIPPLQHHAAMKLIEVEASQDQTALRYEQALTTPQPTVILGAEQDMGVDRQKLGISLPLPLWHNRDGQIAAAKAKSVRSQAGVKAQVRALSQDWARSAVNYQLADNQVKTFESGLLSEAQSAFKVAQAAYQYGERGILDFIDAQRTLASIQRQYLNSQFQRRAACIELKMHLNAEVQP